MHRGRHQGTVRTRPWRKPPNGVWKLNCDGSWQRETLRGGFGWVIRDWSGKFVRAGGHGSLPVASSLAAEAIAVREGIQDCVNREIPALVVETDSQVLVDMLLQKREVDESIGNIIYDIRVLATRFRSIEYCNIPRASNRTAHLVVQHARCLDSLHIWDFIVPVWLSHVIDEDAGEPPGCNT